MNLELKMGNRPPSPTAKDLTPEENAHLRAGGRVECVFDGEKWIRRCVAALPTNSATKGAAPARVHPRRKVRRTNDAFLALAKLRIDGLE